MTARRTALALLCVLPSAAPAAAQAWHTVSAERPAQALDTLHVRVEYTVGAFRLTRGEAAALYEARLRYDADRFEPVRTFDEGAATLRVGVRGDDDTPLRVGSGRESGSLELALSPQPALDLGLELGATDAKVELGGLRIARLAIESGASDITLSFATPNPIPMRELRVHAGVARLRATGLGQANAERVRIDGGVGSVDLDFSGSWQQAIALEVELTVGSATIRVPADAGVRLEHSKVLASLDVPGLTERDGAFVSDNWDSAPRRITISAETVFGRLQLVRTPD